MTVRPAMRFPLHVLALGAIALLSMPIATAIADDFQAGRRAPRPPQVTFSRSPMWESIPGTGVSWIREQQRPDYDLFRYGSRYYIYNDGYWYRSSRWNQKFVVIDERSVPRAFSRISNDHWRSYPAGWMNPKNPHYSGRHDNGVRAGGPPAKGKQGKKGR